MSTLYPIYQKKMKKKSEKKKGANSYQYFHCEKRENFLIFGLLTNLFPVFWPLHTDFFVLHSISFLWSVFLLYSLSNQDIKIYVIQFSLLHAY